MSVKSIGSRIQLAYQVNFPTFTPDQFTKVLKEKGFQMTPSQAITPQGQPTQLNLFSKGNLIIFFAPSPQNPTQRQIIFQVLNRVNLKSLNGDTSPNEDISSILLGLNIREDVVSTITFTCTTRADAIIDPMKGLTNGIKPELLKKINEAFSTKLNVTSLRLGTTSPSNLKEGKGFTQLILEPLGNDPTKQFFVNVTFQTSDMKKFDDFINGFGEDVILSMIEAITSV